MTNEVQNNINRASDVAVQSGIAAAVGYACARAFKVIYPPSHAAVFLATSVVVSKVIDPFFEQVFNGPNANTASRVVGNVLSTCVGTAISASAATALGFYITFSAGLTLCAIVTALRIITFVGLELAAAAAG